MLWQPRAAMMVTCLLHDAITVGTYTYFWTSGMAEDAGGGYNRNLWSVLLFQPDPVT
jgi:hypothetical protein